MHREDPLIIAGRSFQSRLLLGTGKFASHQQMAEAAEVSGAEIVTMALRRVDPGANQGNILDLLDPEQYLFLPNTSGARNADEAVRLARLARAGGISDWIKLEVTPQPSHLLPDSVETLRATEILVKEGFTVLPYMQADPILAKQLAGAGAATVMPLGAPIGTNRGLQTRDAIALILQEAEIPVIVDAGLGAPSHAAEALEMGADAVLVNTAIATAEDPVAMAKAFRLGCVAGRLAYLAGRPAARASAEASSPLTGFLGES